MNLKTDQIVHQIYLLTRRSVPLMIAAGFPVTWRMNRGAFTLRIMVTKTTFKPHLREAQLQNVSQCIREHNFSRHSCITRAEQQPLW